MKKCKYCISDIDSNAKVCPNCQRNLTSANNPLLLIPIFFVLFFIWCFFSSDAPEFIKSIFCELDLRSGAYCREYNIEINFNR